VGSRFDLTLIVESGVEVGGFKAREALHAPLGVGELADEFLLEGVFGMEGVFEGCELGIEFGGVFAGQDGVAGEKAVFEGVLRDVRFAFFGARTG
jgi:hypothetical protein